MIDKFNYNNCFRFCVQSVVIYELVYHIWIIMKDECVYSVLTHLSEVRYLNNLFYLD